MRRLILLMGILLISKIVVCQYKNDNVLFRTIYLQDLCDELQHHNGYILLDVRSDGEFNDTLSSSPLYNIGHFKDAKHISIQDLPTRWKELIPYKDRPLFVYCSHSQRSRRASKMLADSGFTKVFNINGGLSTIQLSDPGSLTCVRQLLDMKIPYQIISPLDLCNKLSKNEKDIFLLDVRPDSAFKGISNQEKAKVFPYVKNSVNIPLSGIGARLSEIPRNKEIIVMDEYGDESAKAARELASKGFTSLSVLFEGIDACLDVSDDELPCKNEWLVNRAPYKTISTDEFVKISLKDKDHLVLDTRPEDEFRNESFTSWRNIGNIKNATNIPTAKLESRLNEIQAYKGKPVLLYGFTSGPEVFQAAGILTRNGFTDVRILGGGIFHLRWTAANIKGKNFMEDWVVNVPAINK